MPTDTEVTRAFADAARHELREAAEQIRHCVAQLTDEDLWHRPDDRVNAIGNLILHLCGNLRQWVIHSVGGAADVRDRPAEFAQRDPIPSAELLQLLVETVAEADAVLARLTPDELVRSRHIQIGQRTGVAAIFHSVSHFVGHAQEITHMTRRRLGAGYQVRKQY
jgi:hypothetical protein